MRFVAGQLCHLSVCTAEGIAAKWTPKNGCVLRLWIEYEDPDQHWQEERNETAISATETLIMYVFVYLLRCFTFMSAN